MISESDVTTEGEETARKSKDPSVMMAANGTTHTTEETTVYVCDLEMFVQVQLLKASPAVLSLEKLCEENGYLYEWRPDQSSYLIKNGRTSSVKATTTCPWLFQTCKQPITRHEL